MPISTAAKLAAYKQWSAQLHIGATLYYLTELPSRTLGQDQQRGTCTMTLSAFPAEAAGTLAYVDITLNGETERYFSGKVDVRPMSNNPPQYQITLIDTLGRLNKKLNNKQTWSNRTWPSVVRDMLNKAGISDSEIAEIYDPGDDFRLGANYKIEIEAGQTIETIMRELLTFAGADMGTDADGLVHVIDSPGWPEDTSSIIYAYGADKGLEEFGLSASRRTLGGSEDVIKSFKAKGPRRPDRKIPDATFTRTDIAEGDYEEQEYKYCQTDDCARSIASREIVRLNRQSTEVEVTAPLNPSIHTGDTIMYRDQLLGYEEATPALVLAVSSSGHTMTMRLSVGARPAEGTIHINPPPNANFDVFFEQQPITVAGVSAVRVLVQCTDTSTDSGGFHIESWEWTASCDTAVEPESSDERHPNFIFDTLDNAQITLVVESTSGEGDSETKAIVPTAGQVFTRTLSAATDEGWLVLAGTTGWRSWGEDCTAVPGINDQGPFIAGFGDGRIYKTDNYLFTEPELLAELEGGAVRCLFVNEGSPMDMLAGVGNNLHRSMDGGVFWELIYTFDDDINYVESSPVAPTQIYVCAGKYVYQSFDGASFTILLTGVEGSTCRKLASAPWGTLAVWSGTTDINDAYQFVGGGTLDWTAVTPEHMPLDLASVTALQYEEGYLLVTGAANDVVRDGLYQQLAYLASGGLPVPVFKVLANKVEWRADGQFGGVCKIVNHKTVYPIAVPEFCFRIGYGAPTETPSPPEIIILPTNEGADFYHHKPLTGWAPHAMPIPYQTWGGIAVNHANPAEWMIWTKNNEAAQMFFTPNMGINWIEVYLPETGFPKVRSFTFTGLGSSWVACLTYNSIWGTARGTQVYMAKGTGANNESQKTFGDHIVDPAPTAVVYDIPYQMVAGADGAICGSGNNHPDVFLSAAYGPGNERWYRIDPAILTPTLVGASTYGPWDTRFASPNGALATWNTNVGKTANHQSNVPTAVISAGGSVVEVETGVYCGTREGIAKINDFDTAPTVTIVAGGGEPIGPIVRGARRRGVAAMGTTIHDILVSGGRYNYVFSFNGTEWVTTQTPLGVAFDPYAIGMVEL